MVCDRGAAKGARGRPAAGHEPPGHFLEPTMFDRCDAGHGDCQRGGFRPGLSVFKFGTTEAIEIANGTDYGLVGGVFTRDLDRATRVARRMRAGQIFVNEWYAGGVETPFGGYGKSGYGREKGARRCGTTCRPRNIAIRLGV
jgi:aldehyde dehydrogenase (NAD+)